MTDSANSNKRAILKSTSLMGGSSLISVLIGMLKTKFVAVLLGPAGVGFMGVLVGFQQIVVTAAGLGMNSSGVRQIAHSASSGDAGKLARTVRTLRSLLLAAGAIGMVIVMAGSKFWSKITFGSAEYAFPILLLGVSVFFSVVSTGQSCVIQGSRRIGEVAKINILGAISGMFIAIPCFFFLGIQGVAPSLILSSIALLLTSWWFARRIQIEPVRMNYRTFGKEATALISLGVPFMLSLLMSPLSAYLIRAFLNRVAGLEAVGQFQAANSLASVLVNFVLTAMGTDYFPRLSAVADRDNRINEELNAQTEIALLLAIPALAVTVAFMPLAVHLFYSTKFDEAIPILRWAIFGVLGRVISWPMGFILLAKGRGGLFFFTELLGSAFNVGAVMILYPRFGLQGAGIAFALLYLFYSVLMYILTNRIAHTRWTKGNVSLIGISLLVVGGISSINEIPIPPLVRYAICVPLLGAITVIALRQLMATTGLSFRRAFKRPGHPDR